MNTTDIKIENLTSGNYSQFAVPIVHWAPKNTLNRVEALYDACEPASRVLPIVLNNEYLAIIHPDPDSDGKAYIATVFNNRSMNTIMFKSIVDLWDKIPMFLPSNGNEVETFKVSDDDATIVKTHFYGNYYRRWHLRYAADYFGLWNPVEDSNLLPFKGKDIFMWKRPYWNEDVLYWIEKSGKITRVEETFRNDKYNVVCFGHMLFENGQYIEEITDIFEAHNYIRRIKDKSAQIVSSFFTKEEVMRLGLEYYPNMCENYRNKIDSLRPKVHLIDLIRILEFHKVKWVMLKEYGYFPLHLDEIKLTSRGRKPGRKPLGRKPSK